MDTRILAMGLLLAGCVTSSVVPLGDGSYMVSTHTAFGLSNPRRARDKAAEAADDYCPSGKTAHIKGVVSGNLVFTCVHEATETEQMNAKLTSLIGQNIKAAVAKLGYPDSKREMLGDTIYLWSMEHHGAVVVPGVATTIGEVGGTSYSQNTYSDEVVPVDLQCRLQLVTDAAGTITHYQCEGNSCKRYLDALNR